MSSRIPPSAANIWGSPDGCRGWGKMVENYPEAKGQSQMEGDAVHEFAGMLIRQFQRGPSIAPGRYIGATMSNGIVIDEEMYESALMYAENVSQTMQATRIFGDQFFGLEHRIGAPLIHPESNGEIDCFIFHRSAGHLWIWEYKNGYSIVEEFENWQLINYLAGLITLFDINGIEDREITVHARIVQPRGFHRDGPIREWCFKLCYIRGHINRLKEAATEATSAAPIIRSGPQCRKCSARFACPEAIKAGIMLYEATGQPIPNEPTPATLGVLYRLVQRAKAQIECLHSGYEEQIKSLIRSGVNVPGYIVEEGQGRETWNKSSEEIIRLGEMLGVNLKKEDTISPAQAKKIGVDAAIIAAYSHRPKTGFKVVADNNTKARKVFSL